MKTYVGDRAYAYLDGLEAEVDLDLYDALFRLREAGRGQITRRRDRGSPRLVAGIDDGEIFVGIDARQGEHDYILAFK